MKAVIVLPFFLFANVLLASTAQITQWVRINNPLNGLEVFTSARNLEITKSDCGYQCTMVRLGIIPRFHEGELQIDLYKKGGCRGDVSLPFTLEDSALVTQTNTYYIRVDGNYCSSKPVKLTVNKDAEPQNGYIIDMHYVD